MQDRVGMKLAMVEEGETQRAKKEAWLSKKSLLLTKDEGTLEGKWGQQATGRVSQERSDWH